MITVLDAAGNDVTARVMVAAPPVLPVQPEEPDEVYGSRLASRRQALLQALGAQVWWHMGLEPKKREPERRQ